jgi:hypothetical protein
MAEARNLMSGPLQLRQSEDGVIIVRQTTELGPETMILSARNAALLAEAILDLQGARGLAAGVGDWIEEQH